MGNSKAVIFSRSTERKEFTADLFFISKRLRSIPGTVNELFTFQCHEESTKASFYRVRRKDYENIISKRKHENVLRVLGRFLLLVIWVLTTDQWCWRGPQIENALRYCSKTRHSTKRTDCRNVFMFKRSKIADWLKHIHKHDLAYMNEMYSICVCYIRCWR